MSRSPRTPPTPSVPPPIASSPGRCSPGVTPSESAGGRRTVPYHRGHGAPATTPSRRTNGEARVPASAGERPGRRRGGCAAVGARAGRRHRPGDEHVAADAEADAESPAAGVRPRSAARRQATQEGAWRQAARGSKRSRAANRRPSGRERHDEKITVYVSAEELMDLEHARLVLRGEHGSRSTAAGSSARRSPSYSPILNPAGTRASSYDGFAGGSGSLRRL